MALGIAIFIVYAIGPDLVWNEAFLPRTHAAHAITAGMADTTLAGVPGPRARRSSLAKAV